MKLVNFFLVLTNIVALVASMSTHEKRWIVYLTGQHPVVPSKDMLHEVTHVAMAFMRSDIFNSEETPSEWPLFSTIAETRAQFLEGTAIQVAIGGWGDTAGFEKAALTDVGRKTFAGNIAAMVHATGADGVDIDWEYPGGNGEDYKQVTNAEKAWQIEGFPLLLAEIRAALGPDKVISAAVPGLERDLIAFTPATVPRIFESVDFLNVMTYDLLNRRDNVTKHHTGVQESLASIDAYLARGAPADRLNLGLAFYTKWVYTIDCPDPENTVGCPTLLLEDPVTGGDLGRTGGFSWHDPVPEDQKASFERALLYGTYDKKGGGHYYWDSETRRWWTFDTPEAIERKFPLIVDEKHLGGVFAWGLGEDAPEFRHLQAVNKGLEGYNKNGEPYVREEL